MADIKNSKDFAKNFYDILNASYQKKDLSSEPLEKGGNIGDLKIKKKSLSKEEFDSLVDSFSDLFGDIFDLIGQEDVAEDEKNLLSEENEGTKIMTVAETIRQRQKEINTQISKEKEEYAKLLKEKENVLYQTIKDLLEEQEYTYLTEDPDATGAGIELMIPMFGTLSDLNDNDELKGLGVLLNACRNAKSDFGFERIEYRFVHTDKMTNEGNYSEVLMLRMYF